MRPILATLFLMGALAAPADAAEPLPATAAPAPAARKPLPVVGPTASIAIPLERGKAVGVAIGLQAIVPVKSWRFAAEVFTSTPTSAFTPAVGGDVGVGLVDKNGLGGSLALYGRHVLPATDAPGSTQLGPGFLLLSKVAPTVVITVPFVVWVDVATRAVTPTLGVKAVLGVPYGKR